VAEARSSYEKALALIRQEPKRRFLEKRLRELGLNKIETAVEFRKPRTTIFERPLLGLAHRKEKIMKYICLGFYEPDKFEALSETERNAMFDECFDYDDVLRKNGHFAGGEALQSASTATTLRWKNGKVAVTDGPYVETKEQLGGILLLEARDLNHAIQLISQHPGVKNGPFEIRPAADLTEIMRESEQRRAKHKQ
jgi:hypothetical protein